MRCLTMPSARYEQTTNSYKKDPRYPGLQFKQIGKRDPSIYSARASDHYRVIGFLEGDTVTWFWVGTHEEYNKLWPRL